MMDSVVCGCTNDTPSCTDSLTSLQGSTFGIYKFGVFLLFLVLSLKKNELTIFRFCQHVPIIISAQTVVLSTNSSITLLGNDLCVDVEIGIVPILQFSYVNHKRIYR